MSMMHEKRVAIVGASSGIGKAIAQEVSNQGGETILSSRSRDKLERGTLSAFKREARHIIDRDIPHISHIDNKIKIFLERVKKFFLMLLFLIFFLFLLGKLSNCHCSQQIRPIDMALLPAF